jgi:uncharacterized lipoprotein NlpE involved in copper resistance
MCNNQESSDGEEDETDKYVTATIKPLSMAEYRTASQFV